MRFVVFCTTRGVYLGRTSDREAVWSLKPPTGLPTDYLTGRKAPTFSNQKEAEKELDGDDAWSLKEVHPLPVGATLVTSEDCKAVGLPGW